MGWIGCGWLGGVWCLVFVHPRILRSRRVIVANMLQWLQQFTGVSAILSCGPSIFQSANVPLSALGVRNCQESVYLGRHCLYDAGHGQVGEKNAVAHRCALHGRVLGSDGGRRPLGSCFSQSSSRLARADARVPLHVCVCDFLGRGAVGLPQRHLSHEREGESHVHVGLLPMVGSPFSSSRTWSLSRFT